MVTKIFKESGPSVVKNHGIERDDGVLVQQVLVKLCRFFPGYGVPPWDQDVVYRQ
jgi:hypothetical protein